MSTSQTFKELHSDLRPYNPSLKLACMIKKEWNVICTTTNTVKPVYTNLVRNHMVNDSIVCNCHLGIKGYCWGIKLSSVGIDVSFILDLGEILHLGCWENTGAYQIGDQRRIFFCGGENHQVPLQDLKKSGSSDYLKWSEKQHRYFI